MNCMLLDICALLTTFFSHTLLESSGREWELARNQTERLIFQLDIQQGGEQVQCPGCFVHWGEVTSILNLTSYNFKNRYSDNYHCFALCGYMEFHNAQV
ncbi:hypothetical protein O6H91_04G033800 [Diphasiastrum complanatum]|uniref:Uncharacterized protein n=1 Tax=Diphasiastrum complanatum TaxID=34168 RepID=A0ACC2DVM8_DIPCM|nr:hypothetical protein O6H91_04G033800 [Diphasiastrum complanatum]